MVPLYVTNDGQAFSARYGKKIHSAREIVLTDAIENIRNSVHSVVIGINTTRDLSEKSEGSLYDSELVTWVSDTVGTPFAGVVSDTDAIISLIGSDQDNLTRCYQVIYVIENRIKFLLVDSGKVVSQVHVAEIESELGVKKLLQRISLWYEAQGVTVSPSTNYFIGEHEIDHSSECTALFPDVKIEYLIAAGVSLIKPKNLLESSHPINRTLRLVRALTLLLPVFCIVAMGIFYGLDSKKIETVDRSIADSQYEITLDQEVVVRQDSLFDVAVNQLTIYRRLSKQRRWSDILSDFSAVEHEGIILNRFGSRDIEGTLALAFDGEGKTEQVVTGYVKKLQESDAFSGVTLTKIDRTKRGKYRFRIQCNVK